MKISEMKKLTKAVLNKGAEILNPKPRTVLDPGHESLEAKIQRMIVTNQVMMSDEFETYEESQDFEIDSEFERDMESEMSRYQVIENDEIMLAEYEEKQKSEIVDSRASDEVRIKSENEIPPPHPEKGGESSSDPEGIVPSKSD